MAASEEQKARFRERYANDPELREKIKRRQRERYHTDPEHRERVKARGRKYQRAADLKRKFGISVEQYDEMLHRQNGVCAILGCGAATADGKRLHVDHCHTTGRVRGLLCGKCNRALGLLDDDPARITALAEYAAQHVA